MKDKPEKWIIYKIRPGDKIKVYQSLFNNKIFYKTKIVQKNYDDSKKSFDIELTFKRGVVVPNDSQIIVKQAIENYRVNPKDEYHPIVFYTILDFDIVKSDQQLKNEAINDFNDILYQNEYENKNVTSEDLFY